MQKLPAFASGALYPYQAPQIPDSWKAGLVTNKPKAYYAILNMPLYIVIYESWWMGRNAVSKHFTGKDSTRVGGVPSTVQGYSAAYLSYIGLRMVEANVFRWSWWNIAPSEPWRWNIWQWKKSVTPARWATGVTKTVGAFLLGAIKVGVDKIEVDRRIKQKDIILAEKAKVQKARSEASAKEAAAAAAAAELEAKKKAEAKAARKAAKKAAKAAGISA